MRERFANYQQALDYLNNFTNREKLGFHHEPGDKPYDLTSVKQLSRELNNPQKEYLNIHVAGTKGKGSTAHYIASIFQNDPSFTVGLYTSPHFCDLRERIRVEGEKISKNYFVKLLNKLLPYLESRPKRYASVFEIMTVMAFSYFKISHCNVAVIETGMGGELDATNIIKPYVGVITPISLDHTAVLGNTIEEIAEDISGIIKTKRPVITYQPYEEAMKVISKKAEEQETKVIKYGKHFISHLVESEPDKNLFEFQSKIKSGYDFERNFVTTLPGLYQSKNASLAITTCEALKKMNVEIDEDSIYEGIQSAKVPGRMEVISEEPTIIFDGAHNGYSMTKLFESLRVLYPGKRIITIFGCNSDKNIKDMSLPIKEESEMVFLSTFDFPRASSVGTLKEYFEDFKDILLDFEDPVAALNSAKKVAGEDQIIIITGSFHMLRRIAVKEGLC